MVVENSLVSGVECDGYYEPVVDDIPDLPPPSPSPTPSPTASVTPTSTHPPTPTVTPTVTPTPTPSPLPPLPTGIFSVGFDYAGQLGDGIGVSWPGRFCNVMSWSENGNISSLISLDSDLTVTIVVDGFLFAWGDNSYGAAGTGSLTSNVFSATNIGGGPVWKMVAGAEHTKFAITNDGKLYAWGRNNDGRLGLGDTTDRATPTQIGTDTDWAYVSTAGVFTYAIKTDGTLWSWGNNVAGQLGLGDTINRNVPTRVGTASNWTKVAVSQYNYSAYAINSSGELYSCGDNYNGILGLGDSGSGTNRTELTRVGSRTDWQDIYPGTYSSVIVGRTLDGLYSWGKDRYNGMLGNPSVTEVYEPTLISSITDFTKVVSTQNVFLALRANGDVYGWGYNYNYNLSPTGAAIAAIVDSPTILSIPEPIADIMCQAFHPMIYATSEHKIYAWGNNIKYYGQVSYAPGLPPVVEDATVMLDYTGYGKPPVLVAQTTDSATFATKNTPVP